jgi:hypothetical protein
MDGYSTTPPKCRAKARSARGQVLAGEEDHQMVEPGTPARRDRAVIKVCREIDFGDLNPERAGDRTD